MKKIKIVLVSLLLFLLSSQLVLAQATCTVNGREVPCPNVSGWILLIPVIMFGIGIVLFAFWLWMLIDAIMNQKEDKAMWVILIILLSVLGAIIYYFTQKRKRKTVPTAPTTPTTPQA